VNLGIRYLTEYRYDGVVTDNLNALRVRPATTPTQRVDDFVLRVDPDARVQRHVDYFGTEVAEFGIPRAHERLAIEVRARVTTAEPAEPEAEGPEELATVDYEEAAGEFVLPWGAEPGGGALDELVEAVHAGTPLETVRRTCDVIPDRFAYDQHATYVGSTVSDLLEAGGGVCQDFAHLALILLRRHGIAARYVSGYLWVTPSEGDGSDSVEVHTHAWVEALVPVPGGEPVWLGADPTNRRLAGATHVKIGHGRFYADVPPVKGVYRGSPGADLSARVEMKRLDVAAG
jgi:transglutaminase-like putative cysteine protease